MINTDLHKVSVDHTKTVSLQRALEIYLDHVMEKRLQNGRLWYRVFGGFEWSGRLLWEARLAMARGIWRRVLP